MTSFYRHGYRDDPQEWEDFRREVTRRPEFRFDFYVKSRGAVDLQKRSDFLVRVVEKDNLRARELKEQALEQAQKEERARKRALKKELKRQQEAAKSSPPEEGSDSPVTGLNVAGVEQNGHNITSHNGASSFMPVLPTVTDAISVPAKVGVPAASKVSKKKKERRSVMSDAVEGDRVYKKRQRLVSPIGASNAGDRENTNGSAGGLAGLSTTEALALAMRTQSPPTVDSTDNAVVVDDPPL